MISSCKAHKRKSARDIVYVFYTHTESERYNLLTAYTNGVEQHKRTRKCICVCVSVGWFSSKIVVHVPPVNHQYDKYYINKFEVWAACIQQWYTPHD